MGRGTSKIVCIGILIMSLFWAIVPAFAELTESDLARIGEIVGVEILGSEKRILEQVDAKILRSEKRILERIDVKLQNLEQKMDNRISSLEQKMKDRISGMADLLTRFLGIGFGIITALMIAIPTVTGFLQGRRGRRAEDSKIAALEKRVGELEEVIKLRGDG